LLYIIYTADLPTSPTTTIATFADDTAVLATDSDPAVASQKLQTHLLALQIWLQKWRMQANAFKSVERYAIVKHACSTERLAWNFLSP
jgi:hypothetical protein